MKRPLSLALGPAAALAAYAALGGAALEPQARALAGVLACAVLWWMTEALPLAVTALLSSAFCVLLGVAPARQVMAPYADPVIFLFLGSFWIAQSMSVHGLDRRLALKLLSVPAFNRSPRRLLLGLTAVAAAISLWVSNTATTAMLLPVVLGMLGAIPAESRDPALESRLLLALTFAASVGGLGTPVGTPPNLIGMGMLERLGGVRIGFGEWMRMALPLTAAAAAFVVWILGRDLRQPRGWERLMDYLAESARRVRPMSRGEANTLAALGLAVVLWVGAGERIPEGVSALLASSLLFVLPAGGRPTLTWDQACRIDWGVLLLFGGGMSLGQLLFDTRLAQWLGDSLVGLFGIRSSFGIAGVSAALALLTSELASNTASANIAVPTALALAKSAGAAPALPALAATLASSFGFLLPVSTAPNALVYGTGRVPLRDMMRFGLALDLFGFLAVWLGLSLMGV